MRIYPRAELIDTLWNVNHYHNWYLTNKGTELIDTLWNVNLYEPFPDYVVVNELIDTLWNVNLVMDATASSMRLRINRYIMECKSV